MATMQMSVRPEDLSQIPHGGERIPGPGIMVIFGASGDLTKRKLLPALFHLEQVGDVYKRQPLAGGSTSARTAMSLGWTVSGPRRRARR